MTHILLHFWKKTRSVQSSSTCFSLVAIHAQVVFFKGDHIGLLYFFRLVCWSFGVILSPGQQSSSLAIILYIQAKNPKPLCNIIFNLWYCKFSSLVKNSKV